MNTPFVAKLHSHCIEKGRHLRASEALAATLLDSSGLCVESLNAGIVSLRVAVGMRYDILSLLRDLYSQGGLKVLGPRALGCDFRQAIVVADTCDLSLVADARWLADVVDHGTAVLHLFEDEEGVSPTAQFEALVTMRARTAEVDDPKVVPAVVEIVTGERFAAPRERYAGATESDIKLAVRQGLSAGEAYDLLGKLIAGRQADAQVGDEEVAFPDSLVEPTSSKTGVRPLSEMSGFGPARDWGLRLADEMEMFREGRISWSDLDRGILLSGPPGCGKSTFALAVGAQCRCKVITTGYVDWAGGRESSGDTIAKHLTKRFAEWREMGADEPVIVFVDELDSIGRRGVDSRSDYWFSPIINAWLAFLDGALPRTGVVVMAATNYPERIDPALLRPGRLERHVVLPQPSVDDLEGIVRHHLGPDALIDLDELQAAARACRGMTPADVAITCREARRVARMCGRKACADDVVCALLALSLGERPSPAVDRLTCIHEAGHAVVGLVLGMTLLCVEVDFAMGRHAHAEIVGPTDRVDNLGQFENDIVVLIAGRAAEEVILGEVTAGAASDLKQATALAVALHVSYGLGAAGLVSLDPKGLLPKAINDAVEGTLDRCYARALSLVRTHRRSIERVADELRQYRYLDGPQVQAIILPSLASLQRGGEDDHGVPEHAPGPRRRGHGWGRRLPVGA